MVWVLVLYSLINVAIQTFIQPKFTGDVVGLSHPSPPSSRWWCGRSSWEF